MANYTLSATGTAANLAAALDGDPTVNSECLSAAGYASYGAGASPGDHFQFADNGGVYRAQFTILESGTEGSKFVYEAYSGDTPVIKGSDLVTSWASHDTNTWVASFPSDPEQVFTDGTWGEPVASIAAVIAGSDGDWYYDGSDIYLHDSAGDPDTRSSPGIEAGSRQRCFSAIGKDYFDVDGITFAHAEYANFQLQTCSYVDVTNCTFEWSYVLGAKSTNSGTVATTPYSNVLYEDCLARYNGGSGIGFATNCSYVTVRRCEAHSNGLYQTGHGEHSWVAGITGFGDGLYLTDCLIEQCYSHDNGPSVGDGIGDHGIGIWHDHYAGSAGHPNISRHNLTMDNKSFGQYIEKNQYMQCYGNISVRDGQVTSDIGGIRIATGVSTEVCENNTVTNNTIVDSGGAGIYCVDFWIGASPTFNNNVVKNNIVTGSATYEFYARFGATNDGTRGDGNVYENNCFGAEDTGFIYWNGALDTYDAFISASSMTDNNIETEPTFTDAGSDDYSLASDCDCIDAGENLGPPYSECLMPSSDWTTTPIAVVTGDQGDY